MEWIRSFKKGFQWFLRKSQSVHLVWPYQIILRRFSDWQIHEFWHRLTQLSNCFSHIPVCQNSMINKFKMLHIGLLTWFKGVFPDSFKYHLSIASICRCPHKIHLVGLTSHYTSRKGENHQKYSVRMCVARHTHTDTHGTKGKKGAISQMSDQGSECLDSIF